MHTNLSPVALLLLCACHAVEPAAPTSAAQPPNAASPARSAAAAAPVVPPPGHLGFPTSDRIVVTHAPHADFAADDVREVVVTDPATVRALLVALAKVPTRGVRFLKFAPGTAESRVAFYAGEVALGTLRLKGGKVDAPEKEGWDFVRDEDRDFAQMLAGLRN